MFRCVTTKLHSAVSTAARVTLHRTPAVTSVRQAHAQETDQELDDRYENYFNRPDLDGWELRKGINDIQGHDMVPEPKIVIAALKACRRVNDYALAVRYLEAVKEKCGPHVDKIWPFMLTELKPTLTELGISTPEEMGYDKPELALQNVYDIH